MHVLPLPKGSPQVNLGKVILCQTLKVFTRNQNSRHTHKKVGQIATPVVVSIQVKGRINVKVSTASQTRNLSLVVVPGSGPSLLGRDWLKTLLGPEWKEKLLLDWQAIHKVTAIDLSQIMDKYDHLFNKDLGTFVGVQARIHVPDGTKPCFYKARPVPYAIREKVDHELTKLKAYLGLVNYYGKYIGNVSTLLAPLYKL